MNTKQGRRILSRRGALKVLPAAGIVAAGGYLLVEYAPWSDYDGQADQVRNALMRVPAMPAQMLEIVRYATLAANSHNTQPWKFVIQSDAIEIHPDYSRRLPVVDPGDRELWISLGCALENLLIAARAAGYACEVTYPDAVDSIHIRLSADTRYDGPLFQSIPVRQNTRSEYDRKAIKGKDLDQVQALAVEPGVSLHYVLNSSGLDTVLDYVRRGNLSQYADKAFVNELICWLRFNKREALASLDGLPSRCSGKPEVPRWLGRMFVQGTQPQQAADADAKNLRSSAGAVVVVSASDNKTAWVRTGQVYERMALMLTSLNIKSAFLNQPIEVDRLRGQFQSAMGLGEARPQLLVRFGYAALMPRSLRRPAERVLERPGLIKN